MDLDSGIGLPGIFNVFPIPNPAKPEPKICDCAIFLLFRAQREIFRFAGVPNAKDFSLAFRELTQLYGTPRRAFPTGGRKLFDRFVEDFPSE